MLAFLGAAATAGGTASSACGVPGYSYAGFQNARVAHGVRATVVPLAEPQVENGHVAAWVGVGERGEDAGRDGAWIQIGFSAFPDGANRIYYEVKQPGAEPRYTEIAAGVPVGAKYRLAVLETRRPGWWRAWITGNPASAPIYLAGSSGRWRPVVTAETWDGGERVCNRFAYRFEAVAVAAARGGSWTGFVAGDRFQDPGYQALLKTRTVFVARATGWPS